MTVHLVGAGPGAADLLTIRAARLLRSCDVCCYDRLVDHSVLDIVNPCAEMIDVGKTKGRSSSQELINELLVALGREHETVVRLKGGDPFVFGRGAEELAALVAAGVDCEVVPGITSAFSAPLAAGIPVTHRGVSRGVLVVTGHAMEGASVDFTSLANEHLTLVVLMGVEHRGAIADQLIGAGLSRATPVAVIERAFSLHERITRSSLDQLGSLEVRSPAVMVIGAVAAFDAEARSLSALAVGAE